MAVVVKSSKLFYSPPASPKQASRRERVTSMEGLKAIKLADRSPLHRRCLRALLPAVVAVLVGALYVLGVSYYAGQERSALGAFVRSVSARPGLHAAWAPIGTVLCDTEAAAARYEPATEPWDDYDALISGTLRVAWIQ